VKHLSLNLEAQSPLVIRADHAAGGAGSAGYITGTALLGSLATVYRSYYPTDSRTFEQLFLSGGAQYPDLYPANFKSHSMQNASTSSVYALPKTAQSCKRFDGFPYLDDEEREEERHGVRDSLLDWTVFEIGKRANKGGLSINIETLLHPLEGHKECPVCENPMDHFTGFYRRRPTDGRMAKAEASTRLLTRTGINRETGTVQEGILYNRKVFDEHTRFWGMMKAPEGVAASLTDFITEVGRSGLVRIGTGRTRGSGKAHLSVGPQVEEQDSFEDFKTRLQKFDDLLRKQAVGAYKAAIEPYLDTFYFVVTLHSPAILRDEMLRYRGSINALELCRLLGMPDDSAGSFELIYQAASVRRVMGWNEMWGTPRTNEYAIDSGSVFLFAFKGESEQVDPLKQALFKLEEVGIGQRRAEGFGRVYICDPFHREVTLK
jgi:CRISPR-associated protein Csx10